jgi:hypothetical protein
LFKPKNHSAFIFRNKKTTTNCQIDKPERLPVVYSDILLFTINFSTFARHFNYFTLYFINMSGVNQPNPIKNRAALQMLYLASTKTQIYAANRYIWIGRR